MEQKEKISVKTAFYGAKGFMEKEHDEYAFREFQNRLRQGMTSDWTCQNGTTEVKYESGYIHDLERELFNLLNEKTGKGGTPAG